MHSYPYLCLDGCTAFQLYWIFILLSLTKVSYLFCIAFFKQKTIFNQNMFQYSHYKRQLMKDFLFSFCFLKESTSNSLILWGGKIISQCFHNKCIKFSFSIRIFFLLIFEEFLVFMGIQEMQNDSKEYFFSTGFKRSTEHSKLIRLVTLI